jgi:hypothetical protein
VAAGGDDEWIGMVRQVVEMNGYGWFGLDGERGRREEELEAAGENERHRLWDAAATARWDGRRGLWDGRQRGEADAADSGRRGEADARRGSKSRIMFLSSFHSFLEQRRYVFH